MAFAAFIALSQQEAGEEQSVNRADAGGLEGGAESGGFLTAADALLLRLGGKERTAFPTHLHIRPVLFSGETRLTNRLADHKQTQNNYRSTLSATFFRFLHFLPAWESEGLVVREALRGFESRLFWGSLGENGKLGESRFFIGFQAFHNGLVMYRLVSYL